MNLSRLIGPIGLFFSLSALGRYEIRQVPVEVEGDPTAEFSCSIRYPGDDFKGVVAELPKPNRVVHLLTMEVDPVSAENLFLVKNQQRSIFVERTEKVPGFRRLISLTGAVKGRIAWEPSHMGFFAVGTTATLGENESYFTPVLNWFPARDLQPLAASSPSFPAWNQRFKLNSGKGGVDWGFVRLMHVYEPSGEATVIFEIDLIRYLAGRATSLPVFVVSASTLLQDVSGIAPSLPKMAVELNSGGNFEQYKAWWASRIAFRIHAKENRIGVSLRTEELPLCSNPYSGLAVLDQILKFACGPSMRDAVIRRQPELMN